MGVIADEEDGHVQGSLTKMPLKGILFSEMSRDIESGTPVSQTRRERWCRQIIKVVAGIYRREIVEGRWRWTRTRR